MADLQTGHVILDEYLIEKELGRGGMGRVCLVKSNMTGRRFAAKQALIKDDRMRKAFLSELQTWIDLPEHRNIVPCRFFRTVGDDIVIFADYIEGGSLADWISKKKLSSVEQIIDVAIQFAWGLHAIHERGLIHQDVKPGNVMMTPSGDPMVTDFGLARARTRTAEGGFVSPALPPGKQSIVVSVGGMTPAYASPEQRNGKPLSRKTDIWSWGVSVLDMFTGGVSCPYGGHIADEVLHSLIENNQTEEMPSGVAVVLDKCFSKNPEKRWATLADAATALIEQYSLLTGRRYIRENTTRNIAFSLPFLRRGYTGGSWSDPAVWRNALNLEAALRPVESTGKAASAIHDLQDYKDIYEAALKLTGKAASGIENKLALMCLDMGQIYAELDDVSGEIKAYNQCLSFVSAIKPCDETEKHCLAAVAYEQLGLRHRMINKTAEAIGYYHKSLDEWRAVLKNDPDSTSHMRGYVRTLSNLAVALRRSGQLKESVATYDKAISSINEILMTPKNEGRSDDMLRLANMTHFKGVALRHQQRFQDAIHCYKRALEILNTLASERDDIDYKQALASLYRSFSCLSTPVEALDWNEKALEIFREMADTYQSPNYYYELASALTTSCQALVDQNRSAEAFRHTEEAADILHKLVVERGKIEFIVPYYEARLSKLSILFVTGRTKEATAEARRLKEDLGNAINATADNSLRQLYLSAVSHGYWE